MAGVHSEGSMVMSDKAQQDVTECPNCGAPKVGEWAYACTGDIGDYACDYAAGLLKRAERAEAALRRAQRILNYGNATDEDALVALRVINEALEAGDGR